MKAYKEISVNTREIGKKSMTKQLLNNNLIPGVIYLKDHSSACVSMTRKDINAIINDPSAMTRIYEVSLNNKKIFCLLKEVQFDPSLDLPRSFDLMEVEANDVVKVNIPIRILNKDICPGVKSGGDVYILSYNVNLRCVVKNIPYAIEIDVKDCDMGKKFFLKDIKLPEGCEMIDNPILLRIAGRRVIKEVATTETATETTATTDTTTTTETDANKTATGEK